MFKIIYNYLGLNKQDYMTEEKSNPSILIIHLFYTVNKYIFKWKYFDFVFSS